MIAVLAVMTVLFIAGVAVSAVVVGASIEDATGAGGD